MPDQSVSLDDEDLAAQSAVKHLRKLKIDNDTVRRLLGEARTHNVWHQRDVSDDTLRSIVDLMRMGPTSANGSPARIIFLKSDLAKERLRPALTPGNVEKTMSAPVTAILGYDIEFWRNADSTFPHKPEVQTNYRDMPEASETVAFRNSSLQGAYLIVAARAHNLDCGPMSGFDNTLVDREFFEGTTIRSNLLCNLGYGDADRLLKRSPRLDFDTVCEIL